MQVAEGDTTERLDDERMQYSQSVDNEDVEKYNIRTGWKMTREKMGTSWEDIINRQPPLSTPQVTKGYCLQWPVISM